MRDKLPSDVARQRPRRKAEAFDECRPPGGSPTTVEAVA